ncbi:MAG TPA: NfeD family protein [Vicinamibacterales bacterium]|nr:NfeD family protein [Vicinamibacterales bacterium]
MMWWHWLLLGLILIGLEMAASGGFYIIFFGVAALLIAALVLAGFGGPVWLQLLLFSVLSVASLLFFRNPIMRALNLTGGTTDLNTLSGETGTVLEAMAPGAPGRVEVRGTTWSARNVGTTSLGHGARCDVVRSERLTLLVKGQEAHS